ncbi:LuxR family transcriptional regulator [Magnetospira sp. QH-2]|uniref:helix-turn-helix transcriptional regulator n=1 Tax=Magnetospira sp. (strain QH-2) TaxID=1288970 RepID=UPI0003E8163E|nr:LuxR family transcriptional regulator [Magnetospira sp. QH-2]CCQ72900.1 Lux R family transcriptional activator protein [Magnetospira sp. QH-2]
MNLSKYIAEIEDCEGVLSLRDTMHRIAGNFGFCGINFLDAGQPGIDEPFTVGSIPPAWDREYRMNNFIHDDPMLPIVRRSNVAFLWSQVDLPEGGRKRKLGSLKLMEASQDHGFKDGLVVPFHYVDHMGRHQIASCVYFWSDKLAKLRFMVKHKKHDLHVLSIYFAQKMSDLAAKEMKTRSKFMDQDGNPLLKVHLTDRERDTLSWAARGKTADETGDILNLSTRTVNEHLDNAKRKLGANNKTHAATIAMHMGLIDL